MVSEALLAGMKAVVAKPNVSPSFAEESLVLGH